MLTTVAVIDLSRVWRLWSPNQKEAITRQLPDSYLSSAVLNTRRHAAPNIALGNGKIHKVKLASLKNSSKRQGHWTFSFDTMKSQWFITISMPMLCYRGAWLCRLRWTSSYNSISFGLNTNLGHLPSREYRAGPVVTVGNANMGATTWYVENMVGLTVKVSEQRRLHRRCSPANICCHQTKRTISAIISNIIHRPIL